MGLGAVVVLANFGAVALDACPDTAALFELHVVSQPGADGAPELVLQ